MREQIAMDKHHWIIPDNLIINGNWSMSVLQDDSLSLSPLSFCFWQSAIYIYIQSHRDI